MRKCQECGYDNFEGTMVCDDCGFPIVKGTSILKLEESIAPISTHANTVMLSESTDVLLEFVGFEQRVSIVPNQRTVLGRLDENSPNPPDVDLSPYGAFDKGVSRIHAALVRHDASLTLLDLGSSNGTLINGRRVSANQPRVVQDGDEITFGQLVARIYFK
jgi:pSer/pThr/pTyr-binding forkhead associated (FHA) protein